jgi:putative ABC transport system substrate-binding protein
LQVDALHNGTWVNDAKVNVPTLKSRRHTVEHIHGVTGNVFRGPINPPHKTFGPPLNPPIDEAEYRRVFAGLVQDRAEGIVVSEEEVHVSNLKLIAELTEKSRLPAIYPFKMFVEAGGLMSYGTDVSAYGHNIADIVVQILKGAKPSEIPIRQPTKFELVINLKTAKALGLTVPATLLVAADEVIE